MAGAEIKRSSPDSTKKLKNDKKMSFLGCILTDSL